MCNVHLWTKKKNRTDIGIIKKPEVVCWNSFVCSCTYIYYLKVFIYLLHFLNNFFITSNVLKISVEHYDVIFTDTEVVAIPLFICAIRKIDSYCIYLLVCQISNTSVMSRLGCFIFRIWFVNSLLKWLQYYMYFSLY